MTFKISETETSNPKYPVYNADKILSSSVTSNTPVNNNLLQFESPVWNIGDPSLLYTNQYTCSANINFTSINNQTASVILVSTTWDPSNMVDLPNNDIIIQRAGKYLIIANIVSSDGLSQTGRRIFQGFVNASRIWVSIGVPSGTTGEVNLQPLAVEDLSINDIIDMNVQGTGLTTNATWAGIIQVIYLGD
jgi:hypothetical protein